MKVITSMQRSRKSLYSVWIASCAALLYAVLAVMSAGCALAHADQAQNHHHQGEGSSSASHAFCAWACQAASDVVLAPESPGPITGLVIGPTTPTPDPLLTAPGLSIFRSRAPPAPALVPFG